MKIYEIYEITNRRKLTVTGKNLSGAYKSAGITKPWKYKVVSWAWAE